MLQSYFSNLHSVLTSVEDYGFLLRRSLTQALLFFVVTMSLLSLSNSLFFQIRQLPQLKESLSSTLTQVQTYLPSNFSLSWDGQRLVSTGTPLLVNYPEQIDVKELQLPQHAVLITPQELNQEELTQTTALSVLTPTQVYMRNQANQWSSSGLQPVLGETQFTFSPDNAPAVLAQVQERLNQVLDSLATIFYFIGPLWLIASRGWGILLDSFLMFISLRLWSSRASWRRCLKLALYISIPAEIISQASRWLYPNLQLPMFMISFWVLFVVMLLIHRQSLTE